jgi:serine/threonine-protein kinase
VWLALDLGALGVVRHIALKILNPGSPVLNRRLIAAAKASSVLGRHPNIVGVIGVVEDDERPQIALEYVEGETLASLQRSLRFLRLRFPSSIVADVGIAVTEALHHAWTARTPEGNPARITHGDLAPSNLLVADVGVVQVTDFGDPGPVSPNRPTSLLLGTPAYRAPELWTGARPSPSADLFSLGVILWELMTGDRFYEADADLRTVLRERSPEDELAPILARSPEMAHCIGAMLDRDADSRPRSALEAAEALRTARGTLKRPADLMQFVRLVRAGRVDPEERTESLQSMPSLPDLDLEWMPLFQAAGFSCGD